MILCGNIIYMISSTNAVLSILHIVCINAKEKIFESIFLCSYTFNFPNWNLNQNKLNKQFKTTSVYCHPPQPSKIPTGSKGLINHMSNMIAPQVSGLNNEDSTWKIVAQEKEQEGGNSLHQ